MNKRITITVEDSIYKMLVASSEESLRPIATEAVYRMRVGLGQKSVATNMNTSAGTQSGIIKRGEGDFATEEEPEFKSMFKDSKLN